MVREVDLVDTEQIAHLWFIRHGSKPVPFTYESVADGYNGDDWLMQNMVIVVRSILRGESVWNNRMSHPFGFVYAKRECGPALTIKVMLDNVTRMVQVYVKEVDDGDS